MMSRCDQCSFDYDSVVPGEVPAALDSIGEALREGLSRSGADALRHRPRPDVWSALEYACHVRDVLLVQRDRLYLALVEDTPSVVRMYRDERALLARYNAQDPRALQNQVVVAAQLLAQAFAELDEYQWRRRLLYNWPDSRPRDVLWLAAHTVHEGRHHLADFATSLASSPSGEGCVPRLRYPPHR